MITQYRDTIIDSLADAAENYENAAQAQADSGWHNAAAYWDTLANRYSLLVDMVVGNQPLSEDNLVDTIYALELSEANCRELNLFAEADDYECAANYVRDLI